MGEIGEIPDEVKNNPILFRHFGAFLTYLEMHKNDELDSNLTPEGQIHQQEINCLTEQIENAKTMLERFEEKGNEFSISKYKLQIETLSDYKHTLEERVKHERRD